MANIVDIFPCYNVNGPDKMKFSFIHFISHSVNPKGLENPPDTEQVKYKIKIIYKEFTSFTVELISFPSRPLLNLGTFTKFDFRIKCLVILKYI